MRSWHVIPLLLCLSLPSCDKATEVVRKLKPLKSETTGADAEKREVAMDPAALVSNLNEATFDDFIATKGRVMVVVFHAEWCGPCRSLAPVISSVAAEFDGLVNIGRIDVEKVPALAQKFGVQSIPDVRIYRDGHEVDGFKGLRDAAEIRLRFTNHSRGLGRDSQTAGNPKAGAKTVVEPMKKDWIPEGIQRR